MSSARLMSILGPRIALIEAIYNGGLAIRVPSWVAGEIGYLLAIVGFLVLVCEINRVRDEPQSNYWPDCQCAADNSLGRAECDDQTRSEHGQEQHAWMLDLSIKDKDRSETQPQAKCATFVESEPSRTIKARCNCCRVLAPLGEGSRAQAAFGTDLAVRCRPHSTNFPSATTSTAHSVFLR